MLELCVLALLHKGDCYGYEISSQLAQRIELADGTVYPILRKLKSDGMLDTYLQEESGGPPRFALRPSPALRLCLATRFMAFGHFGR